MNRVFTEAQRPSEILSSTGVVICLTPQDRRHAGVVYKNDREWRILHLAWHECLRDEVMPLNEGYVWIDPEPAIPAERLQTIAAFCRLVADRNSEHGLPYAFSAPSNWFDPTTGAVQPSPENLGLTCASFVLAVFSAMSISLLNEQTWQARDSDKQWHEEIILLLERRASPEHIKRVRDSLPAIRFRPEEVAGAAASDPIPANFDVCIDMGAEILALLNPRSKR
jgi:hypothetical protein